MSRTRFPVGRALGILLAVALAASGTASAHQVGGTRFQTPIPLWLLFGGAAATVGLTAIGLAVGGSRPVVSGGDSPASDAAATAAPRRTLQIPAPVGDAAATLVRVGFLALVSLAIVAGFVGPQTPARNVATLFVWAVWLKGVGILAAVVGDPWPVLSPWRTVYEGLARIEGEEIAIRAYPERLGEWPALIGVLAWVGIAENLTVLPRSPAGTAVVVLGYAVTMLAGGLVFGRA